MDFEGSIKKVISHLLDVIGYRWINPINTYVHYTILSNTIGMKTKVLKNIINRNQKVRFTKSRDTSKGRIISQLKSHLLHESNR